MAGPGGPSSCVRRSWWCPESWVGNSAPRRQCPFITPGDALVVRCTAPGVSRATASGERGCRATIHASGRRSATAVSERGSKVRTGRREPQGSSANVARNGPQARRRVPPQAEAVWFLHRLFLEADENRGGSPEPPRFLGLRSHRPCRGCQRGSGLAAEPCPPLPHVWRGVHSRSFALPLLRRPGSKPVILLDPVETFPGSHRKVEIR